MELQQVLCIHRRVYVRSRRKGAAKVKIVYNGEREKKIRCV